MKTQLIDRYNKYFIEGKHNIIKEEEDSFHRLLYQWAIKDDAEKIKVETYFLSLIDGDPFNIGKFIRRFSSKFEPMIDYNALSKIINPTTLINKIDTYNSKAYSTPDEKAAIDFFVKAHSEFLKSSNETII